MSGCVTNIQSGDHRFTVWAHDRPGLQPHYELLLNSSPIRFEQHDPRELFQVLAGELQRMALEIGRLRREQIDHQRAAHRQRRPLL